MQQCLPLSLEVFWCELCETGFEFKSRYERHIKTDKHKYQESITSLIDTRTNDEKIDYTEPHSDSEEVSYYF